MGHPGLSAIARISSALVMVVTLLMWLPSRGIQGAAMASVVSYTVMFLVALFCLLRRRETSLWECLRPHSDDLPVSFKLAALRAQFSKLTHRAQPAKTDDALATLIE